MEAGELERADSVLVGGGRDVGSGRRARGGGRRRRRARQTSGPTGLPETGVEREDVARELDAAIHVFEEVGDEAALARALSLAGKLRFWRGEAAAALPISSGPPATHAAGDRAAGGGKPPVRAYGDASRPDAGRRGSGSDSRSSRPRAETNRRLEVALPRTRAQLEAMQGRFDAARGSVVAGEGVGGGARPRGPAELPYPAHSRLCRAARRRPCRGRARAATRCEALERVGELGFLSSIAPLLADALYMQGRDEEALRLTERWRPERLTVPEDADAQAGWRRVRAKVLARMGDFDEAERLGREAMAILSRADYLDAQPWRSRISPRFCASRAGCRSQRPRLGSDSTVRSKGECRCGEDAAQLPRRSAHRGVAPTLRTTAKTGRVAPHIDAPTRRRMRVSPSRAVAGSAGLR